MEHKVDEATPNPSTLWLAIGIGGFSVFASFFLAIYCSQTGAIDETVAINAHGFENTAQLSE